MHICCVIHVISVLFRICHSWCYFNLNWSSYKCQKLVYALGYSRELRFIKSPLQYLVQFQWHFKNHYRSEGAVFKYIKKTDSYHYV